VSNNNSNDPNELTPAQKKRLWLFGLAVAAVSVFMYVSFIIKTAVKGP